MTHDPENTYFRRATFVPTCNTGSTHAQYYEFGMNEAIACMLSNQVQVDFSDIYYDATLAVPLWQHDAS